MLNQSKVALLSTPSRESPYLATMSLLYMMSKLIGKDFPIIYNHSKVEPQGKPFPRPSRMDWVGFTQNPSPPSNSLKKKVAQL